MALSTKQYTLVGADGIPYLSPTKGAYGGHRKTRIFGRLDCSAAAGALAHGGYIRHRVFFADASTAEEAGYRPCAICKPDAYRRWKAAAPDRARRDEVPIAEFNLGVDNRGLVTYRCTQPTS